MTDVMTQLENIREILRRTLPKMAQHGISPSPKNYAIWYHYTLGDKPSLNEEIDQLLEDEEEFTEIVNTELFERYVSECHPGDLEEFTKRILDTLDDASISLTATGSNAASYSETLDRFSRSCDAADSVDDVFLLIREVVEETRQMKENADRLQQDFVNKTEELKTLRTELEQVRQQASTDGLTGLINRTTFFDILEQIIENATKEHAQPFCLVMLDIDHFKRINDTFGHLVGDKVIRFVADTLKKSIKGQDTAARYGGEEFTLLLPDTQLSDAVILCDKIRERIATSRLVRSGTRESLGQVTISAGVAQYFQGEGQPGILQRADDALYTSKRESRNRVTAASEPIDTLEESSD